MLPQRYRGCVFPTLEILGSTVLGLVGCCNGENRILRTYRGPKGELHQILFSICLQIDRTRSFFL